MLKEYAYKGSTYQFDDDHVPDGAVLIDRKDEIEKKSRKSSTSRNKAKAADDK